MKVSKQNKDLAMMVLGVGVGDIASGYVGNFIKEASFVPDSIKPYAPAGVQLLGGWLLATKVKQPMAKAAGIGMAAYGVKSLVAAFVPSLGIGTVDAFSSNPVVAGTTYNVVTPMPFAQNAATVAGGENFIEPGNTNGTF